MADISKEINDFQSAVYGREVRGSMISLALKLNKEIEDSVVDIKEATTSANNAAASAQETTAHCDALAGLAQQSIEKASETLRAAEKISEDASSKVADAEAWAHGRDDHPQNAADNSKFWNDQSKALAEEAKKQADRAMAYADFVTPDFQLDNNRVYVSKKATATFAVFDNKMYFKMPA